MVARRALSARGKEELFAGRREHRREHGRGVLDQRYAYAPVFPAGEITAGAVDRIDDPCQTLPEPRFVVDAFFRQPAIIRRGGSQPALEQVVDPAICLLY